LVDQDPNNPNIFRHLNPDLGLNFCECPPAKDVCFAVNVRARVLSKLFSQQFLTTEVLLILLAIVVMIVAAIFLFIVVVVVVVIFVVV